MPSGYNGQVLGGGQQSATVRNKTHVRPRRLNKDACADSELRVACARCSSARASSVQSMSTSGRKEIILKFDDLRNGQTAFRIPEERGDMFTTWHRYLNRMETEQVSSAAVYTCIPGYATDRRDETRTSRRTDEKGQYFQDTLPDSAGNTFSLFVDAVS
ncbi:hypothetical protein C0Q70_11064 [Pomacea canaliculata]|uniref:Uncharacterized protein n=1 Tax=Pomacea canaliculata TaxID=400727 RepID=A0A2T7P503_POMCA|nr:hypothetical protein C0Q70_11064 [Pomacea canaliculata]